jgi:hypothetical protein
MSAVKRRLFNVLAAGSLVLCVATILLWGLSKRAPVHAPLIQAGAWRFRSVNGVLQLARFGGAGIAIVGPAYSGTSDPTGWQRQFPEHRFAVGALMVVYHGPLFEYNNQTHAATMHGYVWSVSARHWVVAMLLAVPSVSWMIARYLRARRTQRGQCPTCGYDLRATPERCPECGTAVAPGGVSRAAAAPVG